MTLNPFDPESKRAALRYEANRNALLEPFGKGEWAFALFPDDVFAPLKDGCDSAAEGIAMRGEISRWNRTLSTGRAPRGKTGFTTLGYDLRKGSIDA